MRARRSNILADHSVKITGQVYSTPNSFSNTDAFGFVAEQIGSFSAGGFVVPLTVGFHNDSLLACLPTRRLDIREA